MVFTLIFMFYSLQKYVREQILLAVAVIVKRGSLDKSIDCKSIFHEVSQLISSGNPTVVSVRTIRICKYLICILCNADTITATVMGIYM